MSIGWKLHEGTLGPNDVVAPDERLSWPKTVGLGAQHVVAMFARMTQVLAHELGMLLRADPAQRLAARLARYRRLG